MGKHDLTGETMKFTGLFNDTFSALERCLNLRSRNHRLIASNIANLDTPNYKAFKMAVAEAVDVRKGHSLQANRTHADHLTANRTANDRIRLETVEEAPSLMRGDGNTVNLDREMSNLAENTLMFSAGVRMTSKQFQLLMSAIKGGN